MKKTGTVFLNRVLPLIVTLVLLGAIILAASFVTKEQIGPDVSNFYVRAKVTRVLEDHSAGETATGPQRLEAEVLSGDCKGQICLLENPNDYQIGAYAQEGTKVIALVKAGEDGSLKGSVYNYDRTGMVYLLLGLFAVVTILVGGKKGIATLYALIFTFVCVICMYIPLIYVGCNGILAAILTATVILAASIYIINGWSRKTLCAIIGTTTGVAISGLLAMALGGGFHLSGYQTDDVESLVYIARSAKVQVGPILYAGVLISSLGAVMDVSVSMVAAMDELRQQSPELSGKAFFRSGMRVGKDMIGTMANTLILAYTGSATGVIVSIYSYDMSYLRIMGENSIVTEIFCGLCGTIGVILTVPIQALITTLMYRKAK